MVFSEKDYPVFKSESAKKSRLEKLENPLKSGIRICDHLAKLHVRKILRWRSVKGSSFFQVNQVVQRGVRTLENCVPNQMAYFKNQNGRCLGFLMSFPK
jgi:hypothetical protein